MQARRNRTLTTTLLAVGAALAIFLTACGEESETRGSSDPEAPTIVATSGIAADIVANVGGDDVRVVQLVPDGASPHSYSPSAQQQQELEDSDLLVYFAPALEEALPLETAPNEFAIADHVASERRLTEEEEALEAATEGADTGDGHAEDEGHGDADPHVWMDPTQIGAALPALAGALGEIDPAHAGDFDARAREYAGELTDLDRELEELAASVPPAQRKLVTSHDLMGYFADRYGFEFVGAPFGISPEAEASAAGIDELIDDVEAAGVPAVFAQTGDDPEVLRQVAEEADVEVVDDLLVESLGEQADTYIEMMRYSTERITDALSE